jgi:predicted acetyltransferase
LRYRAARRTDVETLADLGFRAYRVSSLEKRREFYTDHPRFGLKDVRVGEVDGQIVASMVLYPFSAHVRGQQVPVTGIGSVAVSPEHRRRGIGEAFLRSALREMRSNGQAISVLYPFRGSYYRKLGYGTFEMVHLMAIAAGSLPSADETRGVRRLMLPDRPAVQALYDQVAAHGHFALARTVDWWNRRLWGYPGEWVVYEGKRRGQIEGYLYYEVDTSHGPFKLALALNEFVASTPEAHRGLVGYLASLSDQVSEIHHAAPGDNSWPLLLKSSQNLRPGAEIGLMADTGNLGAGCMMRIVDVKAALESLPAAPGERGDIVLVVEDSLLPQNARAWKVSVREAKFKVRPELPPRPSPRGVLRAKLPRLTAPAEALGPMFAGTLSPVRAAEAGLVASEDGAAEVAEAWFRARPAFVYQFNAF